ncbi:YhdP family protein [Halopseudomonas salegens]|uniref:TIGR02099 family protein n=1 Tax=Halopseudomonas salegens TaxID=1434072 RepID=A0A1H2GKG7_9GAMM|nr:YhdP family protein [Halopseudomonas salegens]SDU20127.1 TIGR02099 family protein [Halopseudomonas salegens]
MAWARWTRRLLDVLILLLAGWLILAAAYVSLGRLLVPAVADYQPQVISWFEQATGRAISLQQMQGEMQGSQPVLKLQGLRVHANADPDSPVLFALDRVNARLDVFASLWQQRPVMDALQIDGLAFELLEDATGVWRLKGISEDARVLMALQDIAELLLSQRRITLLDSQIRISPYQLPSWAFSSGDLTLRNQSGHSRLDARVVLPDGEVAQTRIQGELLPNDWRSSRFEGYLLMPTAQWRHRLPQNWVEQTGLSSLDLGGQLWLAWQAGELQDARAELSVPRIVRRDTVIEDLQVQLGYQHFSMHDQLALRLQRARLQDQQLPVMDLHIERNRDQGNWRARLNQLMLEPVSGLILDLLPEQRLHEVLSTLSPQGRLGDIQISGERDWRDWRTWQVGARLQQVAVNAWEGVPGFDGVSGVLQGTPEQGQLQLDMADWSIDLPRLFAEPFAYQRLRADVFWNWQPEQGFTLDVPGAAIGGEEGDMAVTLALDLPLEWAETPPTMDLRASIEDSQASYYARYLPTRSPAFNPAVSDWLAATDVSGDIPRAVFSYTGSLLEDADGREIGLYVDLQSADLLFQPGWPRLEAVDAGIWLEDGRVFIERAEARLWQTRLTELVLQSRRPEQLTTHLDITGKMDGPLEDALRLLQESPLRKLAGDPVAGWQANGTLSGDLQLGIPLQRGTPPEVDARWQVDAEQLRMPQLDLLFRQLAGNFHYQDNAGLTVDNLQARVLGQQIRGDIRQHAGNPRIQLRGQHRIDQLRQWKLLEPLPPGLLSGMLGWQARIDLLPNEQRIQLQSDLQGLALELPQPLGLAAEQSMPAELQLSLQGDQQRWRLSVGDDWRGIVHRDGESLAADLRYRRGQAVTPIWPGISLTASFPRLDVAEWQQWQAQREGEQLTPAALLQDGLLRRLSLDVEDFNAFGWELTDLALSAAHSDDGWVMDIDQQDVRGLVSLPANPSEPRVVELQRLRLPRPATAEPPSGSGLIEPVLPVDPLLEVDPRNLPAVNVGIDQLFWGTEAVGSVRFFLRPQAEGTRVQGLDADLRGLQLQGTLDWQAEPQRTQFRGQLDTDDIGDVLVAWNYAPTLTSEAFHTDLDLQWPGSPAFFAFTRSSGGLSLEASQGMLQSGEGSADALRVFGLLNFTALTRRLRLDFSDIFGRGTAYDSLKGELDIHDGVMQTRSPLILDGPSARLQLDGKLDLPSDQIDMGLLVTLPITNNLPLAALLAGAPQIGGVLFLADRILGDRIARFASVKYRLSGDWQQPSVEFDRAFDNEAALEE